LILRIITPRRWICCLPEQPIENVTLENISIDAEKGLACVDACDIDLTKVNINEKTDPIMRIRDSRNVVIKNSNCAAGTNIFVRLEGRNTRNIVLSNNNLSNAKLDVVFDTDVPSDAVIYTDDQSRKSLSPGVPE
jgi:hypothetical protein